MSISTRYKKSPRVALRTIIAASSLTEARKAVWGAFIDAAAEDEIVSILDMVESDAGALPFLTDNLTAKIEAMSKKDASLWGKIVQEEKEHLSGMAD